METAQKTAIITGGTAGIGFGIAETFAQHGMDLLLSYFHNDQRAQEVEKKLSAYGVKVKTVKADTGNKQSLEQLFAEAKESFGRVDVLVNNIGGSYTDDYDTNERDSMFHHHVMGTVNATELFTAQIGDAQGCIINISSVSGVDPLARHKGARLEAYCCMKAAVAMYTKIAANKFNGTIRVNAIAPGSTETEGWSGADEGFKQMRRNGALIHRFVTPTEIGKTALHIVDNDAIDGQTFIVDGGVVGKGYE